MKCLAEDHRNIIFGIGEAGNVKDRLNFHPNIKIFGYKSPQPASKNTHNYLRSTEAQVRRGQQVYRAALELKASGFYPDKIIFHSAWGEGLFLKEVFPNAKTISYCEFFYQKEGGDLGFDPNVPVTVDDKLKIQIKNTTQLLSLIYCDSAISPTKWQRSTFPSEYGNKIEVVHEGIDTDFFSPNNSAEFKFRDKKLTQKNKIITYCARNLEPYRGFDQLMNSLPLVQEKQPDAQIIVAGGDDVSYGRPHPSGKSYREVYQDLLKDKVNWDNVHFVGKLPYSEYLKVLQISSVHIYLTYPFVLSWSLLEAMSVGCVIIGSATSPVEEVICDQKEGLLVDYFDNEKLSEKISEVLSNPSDFVEMRKEARKTIISSFDLKSKCLPKWKEILTS